MCKLGIDVRMWKLKSAIYKKVIQKTQKINKFLKNVSYTPFD